MVKPQLWSVRPSQQARAGLWFWEPPLRTSSAPLQCGGGWWKGRFSPPAMVFLEAAAWPLCSVPACPGLGASQHDFEIQPLASDELVFIPLQAVGRSQG